MIIYDADKDIIVLRIFNKMNSGPAKDTGSAKNAGKEQVFRMILGKKDLQNHTSREIPNHPKK